jgi:Zn-dependent metalloprotease
MFTFGAGGKELGNFAASLDVVGHEFTHAVIQNTSNLAYEGQSGALNESLADVFGEMIQIKYENPSRPFLVGETVLRGTLAQQADALRNMLDPSKSIGGQPSNVSEIPADMGPSCVPSGNNDNCGVHRLSGVPNKAVALAVQKIGWDKAGAVVYRVMTQRLLQKATFADYRTQVMDECAARLTADECKAFEDGFRTVGL